MIDVKVTGSVPELDLDAYMQAFASEFVTRVQQRTPEVTGALKNGYGVIDINQDGFSLGNSQKYFDFVENGTVKQTPNYMVRTTIEEKDQIAQQVQNTLVKKG